MSSRAIRPKRDRSVPPSNWQSVQERAPSLMREEGPLFPRYVAVVSLMLFTVGAASLLFNGINRPYLISSSWGTLMLSAGILGLLYHAYNEQEFQFRRLYGAFGVMLLIAAIFLRLAPVGNVVGSAFLPFGVVCLFLSLGFLLSFVKNETELALRTYALYLVAVAAVVNILIGLIGSSLLTKELSESFLEQTGIIHLIAGLLFAIGYVGMEGISSQRGFWGGRTIGIAGLLMFAIALVRSLLPWIYTQFGWASRPASFFLPNGLILMYIGVEYITFYLGICSDNVIVVLTRRELAAIFYSPIAYIVLIGTALIGWLNFALFINNIFFEGPGGSGFMPTPEPIFIIFIVQFLAVIPLIFFVPIITMRMLSEEKRNGTLEVLLTAPINEWHVVLAKFLAGLRFYMLGWYIWCAFFIGLRVEGGETFDYRPIIAFLLSMACMGASFIAMGVFFSSMTRHQVLAAVLAFVMMMALSGLYWIKQFTGEMPWLTNIISDISYLDLLISCSRGTITPRLLVLYLSIAVFWLFLTTKVLEARKWS